MAVLQDAERVSVVQTFMRKNTEQLGAVSKNDLRDAVNDIDSWLDENSNVLDSFIPSPVKEELTFEQKVLLFILVVSCRHNGGSI